jgi:hypothetical protein
MGATTVERSMEVPQNKNRTTIRFNNFTPGHILK